MSAMVGPYLRVGLAVCLVVLARRVPALACIGDCNADGHVDADELSICVTIHFGSRPPTDCPTADDDQDGSVSISELIRAVTSSANGCPGAATPTSTVTPTPPPTPTPTFDQPMEDDPFVGEPCTATDELFVNCWPTSGMSIGLPYLELMPMFRLSFDAFCSAGNLEAGDDALPDLACASMKKGLRIYKNKGQFQFQDVTIRSGLGSLRRANSIISLAFGDLDGDGEQDLIAAELPPSFVTTLRNTYLYGAPFPESSDVQLRVFRNQGGLFHEVTEQWGFGLKQYPSVAGPSLKLADVNHDGKLDIAVQLFAFPGPTAPLLFVSQPDGTWKESAAEYFGSDVVGNAFAFAWTDVDQDGEPDFLAANNSDVGFGGRNPPSYLLRRQGEGYIREMIGPLLSKAAAMGVSAIDLDADGWMELLITDIRINHLLKRSADGTWSDLAGLMGLTNLLNINGDEGSGQFVPFTPALIPVVGKLGVLFSAGTDGQNVGKPYMKLFTVEAGGFTDRSEMIAPFAQHNGEGAARADIDGDGCPDLFVGGHSWSGPVGREWIDDSPLLIWNRSSPGQCLSLAFRTTKANRYGIGTLATVESGRTTYTQALYGMGSEYGDDEARLFFPVAAAEVAHVTIRWPDGESQSLDLMPGRHLLHQP
jgi:hypothetical protein